MDSFFEQAIKATASFLLKTRYINLLDAL